MVRVASSSGAGLAGARGWTGRLGGLGAILVALVGPASPAWAASAIAPPGVSATVVRSCVIRAVAPGSVEVGCMKGATAAPIRSSADGGAVLRDQARSGAAVSRGPLVREVPSADGASVLVTVDF